ncbi:Ccdc91 [Phodopus roborovskii]|uniref:Ccdc91 protein n=1 Tax=Phodopus roborovskii TaxID=109678 RepID=A0AAV0ADE0_PHORO|nr:Ccdc91 [Phodopus roborovskii]
MWFRCGYEGWCPFETSLGDQVVSPAESSGEGCLGKASQSDGISKRSSLWASPGLSPALLQSSVKQQLDAIEKQYVSAIEKQAHRCEELLHAQHQRLLEVLDTEKELLREKIQEALAQQSQEQKETLGKYLQEEMQRSKEALESAVKLEKEAMKDVINKAVEEERKNLEKVHAEEREMWKAEHARDQERVTEAIQAVIREQRMMSQVLIRALCGWRYLNERYMHKRHGKTKTTFTETYFLCWLSGLYKLSMLKKKKNLSKLTKYLNCKFYVSKKVLGKY